MATANPIAPFLRDGGVLILDGGLATEFEAQGADLRGGLWSARCLRESPDLVRSVHTRYLEAGADCIATASYQATFEGFRAAGESDEGAADLMWRSVALACEARDAFWRRELAVREPTTRERTTRESASGESDRAADNLRLRPLVAASIGPYGAYLADGSEYTGDYDLDEAGLIDFHRRRWHLLATAGADLVACETVPSAAEARALQRLLHETPAAWAWVSFCCRDGDHLADGTELEAALRPLADDPQIVALGVNCVAPHLVDSLIAHVRAVTAKPVVVYPNSGEIYEAGSGGWLPGAPEPSLATSAPAWRAVGARLIGGCCRTRPDEIRALLKALKP